jgi:acetylornithine/succinyldiaminopimelate/putrescine aminotransferase
VSAARDDLERAIGPLPRTAEEIREAEDRRQVATYSKVPVALVEGRGSWVVDVQGRRYLDLYAGHAVALLGHCHPRLVAAIRAQAGRLVFYSNVVYSDVRAAAVEALAGIAPEGLRRVFLCGSGTEANETALKIARKSTGRMGVVSMKEGFHGRTLGSLGATGIPSYRDPAWPIPKEHVYVPYGDLAALAAAIDERTSALILEPIPSVGGIRLAPADWFRAARRLCDDAGALLVFDEVQTGLGRTGRTWFGEHVGVRPDLLTIAKGIAGGFPAGAVLVREDLAAKVKTNEQGTTFGGGPLASAAIAATVRTIREEDLAERARTVGARLRAAVEGVAGVESVVGLGLMLGVDLDRPAGPVVKALVGEGILVGSGGSSLPNQFRLLPPLTLSEEEADLFAPALARVLAGATVP